MSALRWIAGLAASLAAHVIAGVVLLRALEPQAVPQQPMPESELEVSAYTLERSEARVAPPDPDPATQERASGDRLATGATPSSRARTAKPEAARTAPARPRANTLAPAEAALDALAPAASPAARLTETADPATALPATASPATIAPEAATVAQSIASAPLDPAQAPTAAPAVQPLSAGAPAPPTLAAQNPETVVATPAAPSAVAAQAAIPAAQTLNQARPSVRVAALAQPALANARPTATDAMPLAELAPRPVETPAATPQPVSASVATPPTVRAGAATPPAVRASVAALPAVPASPSRPTATPAVAAIPKSSATPQSVPDAHPAASAIPPTSPALQATPRSAPAVTAQPDAAPIRAALAFPTGEDGAVDPVSFAAFQSFMQPGDLSAGTDPVRDGVAGILAQVPCSRLQVSFDPEATTLVVNGHIPDGDLRGTVVAALQEQMGTSIKVSDNMLVLPRPQCGALAGIASVGLAQSTDQFTNPLVIGEDTQARVFRFTEGQLLSLDMTAPDYDAVIYLDYFDADGNVLHLEPNEYAPLRRATAKTAQQIGARRAGDAGLKLVIGPPYGQEIAVAFAASHPLYDGLRPIQEPAGPYLDWLRERVTEARAVHPDFKGEWVYFFVSTSEG